MKKTNSNRSGDSISHSIYHVFQYDQVASYEKIGDWSAYESLRFTGMEIPLSCWTRSLCASIEYPAFEDPEPIVLPDVMTEELSGFIGFACYETIFVLNRLKTLLLEISDASGGVEVFMNGETAGMRISPPYYYDLFKSGTAWEKLSSYRIRYKPGAKG